ncbi:MAG: hypothetical protein H7836_12595 [Magnetococcus sp. YQC-3]
MSGMKDNHPGDITIKAISDDERIRSMLSVLAEAFTDRFIEKGFRGGQPVDQQHHTQRKLTPETSS